MIENKEFLKKLLVLICVLSMFFSVIKFLKPDFISNYFPLIIIFYSIITYTSFYLVNKKLGQDALDLQNNFMASKAIRLFLSMFALILYIYFVKIQAIVFTFNFLFIYLVFTIFEIKNLLSNLHTISKRK